eukprot:5834049-Pyramimonas_sp.AAC.1
MEYGELLGLGHPRRSDVTDSRDIDAKGAHTHEIFAHAKFHAGGLDVICEIYIAGMASKASSGAMVAYLKEVSERVIFEAVLVIAGWPWIFVKVLFAAYVVQLPFRNFAYYRHQPRDTLRDL